MSNSKRTRSQLTLPELNLGLLGRSPLKEARIALKHNVNHPTGPMADQDVPTTGEAAEQKEVPAKRPSSPLKDTVALRERNLKRAKHEGLDNENEITRHSAISSSPSKKPSSTSSMPSTGTAYTPIRPQRAQSVPAETATPVPHLDLNRVPPSPWRTQALKLRITAVSSMESIPDVPSTGHDTSGDVIMTTPTAGSSSLSMPVPGPAIERGEVTQPTIASSSDIPPVSSPMSSLPTSPADEQPPRIDMATEQTPKKTLDSGPTGHMSPLTPLPPTPWVSVPALVSDKRARAEREKVNGLEPPLRAKTPSAPSSRLPRPSTVVQHTPIALTSMSKSNTKPQAASCVKAMKPKQAPAPAPIPLGGRMTRSASLRQKETKKDEAVVMEAAAKTPARPSNPSSSKTGAISTATASTVAKTPGRRRSMSFSYAQPTSSSVAKSNPSSPTKPQSAIASSSTIRPFLLSRASQPPSSSLSNLSQALEKLNLPPPSRPNTSMGFNRDIRGDTEDEDDANEKSIRSSTSKDDGDIAMRSTGSQPGIKRAGPLKRSATVGIMDSREPSSLKSQAHSKLMLPPPVPKAKLSAAASSSSTPAAAPKRINLQSGMVAGKPKGKGSIFGGMTSLPTPGGGMIFGRTPLASANPKGRVVHRASKQSSLPMVEGSPVKGGAASFMKEGADEATTDPSTTVDEVKEVTNSMGTPLASPSTGTTVIPDDSSDAAVPLNDSNGKGKGKDPEAGNDSWKNASRRASMASQFLSQSLSSLPKTPPRLSAPASEGKGKGRAGLRSASSSYPLGTQTAPGALGKTGESSNPNGAHVSAQAKARASTADPTPGGSGPTSGSLKVLKECAIFVDVRTDDGDDAGALFMDMLKDMGAKMLTRVGQKCTHIVYKNGLMSTLTRYRLLHEPRPLVVGIAWVVECAEQRSKVDEKKFLIDLEGVNIAGSNKRRRSMLPKSLSNISMEPREAPSPAGSNDGSSRQEDRSGGTSSPNGVPDDSPKGGDDLTPLERARRRHNTIKTMFARA